MNVGIEPTTVEQAAVHIATTLGLAWPEDRDEIVDALNDFRSLLYNSYSDLKLFTNVFNCICLSSFPERCTDPCEASTCYQGFTLPPNSAGVEAAWEYGEPMLLRSHWRQAHVGMDTAGLPRCEVIDTGEQMATERALRSIGPLMMKADHLDDDALTAVVDVIDSEGTHRRLQFDFVADSWMKNGVHVRQIVNVALPVGRKGIVRIAQQDGYELSIYAPWETVPSYRKYRVANRCQAGTLFVRSSQRYTPICFDHDVVEVGNQLILKEAGSWIKFRSNTVDQRQIKRAEYSRQEMGRQLRGLKARHTGRNKQDGNPISSREVADRFVLPGYE